MRTITKTHQKRLIAQREEAKFLGFDKVATELSAQIAANPTREDGEDYEYWHEDVVEDVSMSLNDAAVRVQDFFGAVADQRDLNDLITEISTEFIDRIGQLVGADVGAYEPKTPGESD